MVEEDAIASIHTVGLTVVYGDPICIELSHRIGGARVEWRRFFLWRFLNKPIKLTRTRLIEACFFLEP